MKLCRIRAIFDRFRTTTFRSETILAEFNIPEEEGLIVVPDNLLADHVRAVRA